MKMMWKWICALFTEKSVSKNVFLLIVSVIITVSLSAPVNTLADKINGKKEKEITLTFLKQDDPEITNNYIGICDNYSITPSDAYRYIISELQGSDITWELFRNDFGQVMIYVDASKNENKTFTFKCPYYANTVINFVATPYGGKVRVDCGSFSRLYDLKTENSTLIRCTPICEDYGHLTPYFAIFIPLFILVVLVVYISEKYILTKYSHYVLKNRDNKWVKYNIKADFFIIFAGLTAFTLISYYAGTFPRFLLWGDQNHYWFMLSDVGKLFEESGKFYDFRGYLCYFGPALCKYAGAFFGIDPIVIWIVFLNFLAACLFGITFPMLSKKLYRYSLTRPQVYLSAAIMCVLWRSLLAYVLMDLPAAVFFISGFTVYIYFLEKPTVIKGSFCGLLIGLASNLKLGYQFVSLALIVVWTAYFLVKKAKKIKTMPNKKEARKQALKKIFSFKSVSSVIAVCLTFVAVCVPQLLINLSKGVAMLTPYETEASYSEGGDNEKYFFIMEISASRTFSTMRLYPSSSPTDSQIQSLVIDYIGDNTNTLLRYPQLFEMFLRKPMDTLIMMAKKILLGMNVLDSSPYNLEYSAYANSLVWLKCLFNYIILFGGVWAAFRNRKNIKEKFIFFCVFFLCVLINTIGNIEWRGFIVGYLFVNFYFCYSLLPYYAEKSAGDTKCRALSGFYKSLSVLIPAMIIICATIT